MKLRILEFALIVFIVLMGFRQSTYATEVTTSPTLTLKGNHVIPPKTGQLIVQVHPNGCVASFWASGFLSERRLAKVVEKHISGEEPRSQITTDLMRAVAKRDLPEVDRLLAQGAKVNEANVFGCSATFWAVSFAYEDIFASLLKADANVNQTDSVGRSPLMVAASRGSLSITESLIASGAELKHVQSGSYEKGHTALHYAAQRAENTAVIKFLLKHGVNIDAVNQDGQSALMRAARRGNFENVEALLQAGANPNLTDKNGDTALGFAKRKNPDAAEKVWSRFK